MKNYPNYHLRSICHIRGGDIVVVKSNETEKYLEEKVNATKKFYWIGLTNIVCLFIL